MVDEEPAPSRIRRARTLRRQMTGAERRLWARLRGHRLMGLHVRRQVPCGPFYADFAILAQHLAIEIDGATHSTDREIARDRIRDRWFAVNGWRVLRFTNEDVYRRLDEVLDTIIAHLPTT